MSINKKLAAYSALATGLILTPELVKSQINTIVYTDIDPDEIFEVDSIEFPYNAWQVYNVDFDDNGIMDVLIDGSVSTGYYPSDNYRSFNLLANGFSDNSILAEMVTTPGGYIRCALVLNYGDIIDGSQPWQTGYAALAFKRKLSPGSFLEAGYWLHADTNKYLGARFLIGSQYHYGWVRLDVADGNVLYKIKDYAYNAIAEQGLTAGQTELFTGTSDIIPSVPVSFAQTENGIIVSASDLPAGNNILRIINVSGQILYEKELQNGNTEIELPFHGIYIASVIVDGITYSKKISI